MAIRPPRPGSKRGEGPALSAARRVLARTPLVDGHNDLPWAIRTHGAGELEDYDLRGRAPGRTDIPRLRQGGVGVQFWSVYVPFGAGREGWVRIQLEQIDLALRMVEAHGEDMELVTTVADARRAWSMGRVASFLGLEGGHVLDGSLGTLRVYWRLGARYLTLTHNETTEWADSATDEPRHGGLAPFGIEVIGEMNRLGMMVDLSHTSPAVMRQALEVSAAPVIWSHASARALTDHPRNVPDDVLEKVPENGGLVMVTFVPRFVSEERHRWAVRERALRLELQLRHEVGSPEVEKGMRAWAAEHPMPDVGVADVADHVEHVREVAGVEHVGLGGDFDGTDRVVTGLEDVAAYPVLLAELSRRGWTGEELGKVAGENALRVIRAVEEAAPGLSPSGPPAR